MQTKFSTLNVAIAVIAVFGLAACGSLTDQHETIDLDANLKPQKTHLELPPDLINTANENVVTAATLSEDDVIPETVGITVLDNGTERWLEIAAPAEEVWPKLVRYWGEIGAPLILADPKTGIMETDWVIHDKKRDQKKSGLTSGLFIGILADITDQDTSLDKYTVRMERGEDAKTLVFLTHRGSKKVQIGTSTVATHPDWEWVETGQDQEKVKLVIQSIRYSLSPENA